MQGSTAADQQLAQRLDAYALERLGPDPAASDRMRRVVMGAAATRLISETTRAALTPAPRAVPIPISPRFPTARSRRVVAGLLAASMALVAAAGAAFAATPGGPLYDARMWVERVTLPSDPDARANAEIARLEARLAEAVDASGKGNGSAVSAALAAYRATIDEAIAASDGALDRAARLELVLARHLIVLETLLERAPAPARDAIANAIANSGKAVQHIDATRPPKPQPQPTPKAGNGGGNGGGGSGGHGGGGGNGGGPGPNPHPTPRGSPGKPAG